MASLLWRVFGAGLPFAGLTDWSTELIPNSRLRLAVLVAVSAAMLLIDLSDPDPPGEQTSILGLNSRTRD